MAPQQDSTAPPRPMRGSSPPQSSARDAALQDDDDDDVNDAPANNNRTVSQTLDNIEFSMPLGALQSQGVFSSSGSGGPDNSFSMSRLLMKDERTVDMSMGAPLAGNSGSAAARGVRSATSPGGSVAVSNAASKAMNNDDADLDALIGGPRGDRLRESRMSRQLQKQQMKSGALRTGAPGNKFSSSSMQSAGGEVTPYLAFLQAGGLDAVEMNYDYARIVDTPQPRPSSAPDKMNITKSIMGNRPTQNLQSDSASKPSLFLNPKYNRKHLEIRLLTTDNQLLFFEPANSNDRTGILSRKAGEVAQIRRLQEVPDVVLTSNSTWRLKKDGMLLTRSTGAFAVCEKKIRRDSRVNIMTPIRASNILQHFVMHYEFGTTTSNADGTTPEGTSRTEQQSLALALQQATDGKTAGSSTASRNYANKAIISTTSTQDLTEEQIQEQLEEQRYEQQKYLDAFSLAPAAMPWLRVGTSIQGQLQLVPKADQEKVLVFYSPQMAKKLVEEHALQRQYGNKAGSFKKQHVPFMTRVHRERKAIEESLVTLQAKAHKTVTESFEIQSLQSRLANAEGFRLLLLRNRFDPFFDGSQLLGLDLVQHSHDIKEKALEYFRMASLYTKAFYKKKKELDAVFGQSGKNGVTSRSNSKTKAELNAATDDPELNQLIADELAKHHFDAYKKVISKQVCLPGTSRKWSEPVFDVETNKGPDERKVLKTHIISLRQEVPFNIHDPFDPFWMKCETDAAEFHRTLVSSKHHTHLVTGSNQANAFGAHTKPGSLLATQNQKQSSSVEKIQNVAPGSAAAAVEQYLSSNSKNTVSSNLLSGGRVGGSATSPSSGNNISSGILNLDSTNVGNNNSANNKQVDAITSISRQHEKQALQRMNSLLRKTGQLREDARKASQRDKDDNQPTEVDDREKLKQIEEEKKKLLGFAMGLDNVASKVQKVQDSVENSGQNSPSGSRQSPGLFNFFPENASDLGEAGPPGGTAGGGLSPSDGMSLNANTDANSVLDNDSQPASITSRSRGGSRGGLMSPTKASMQRKQVARSNSAANDKDAPNANSPSAASILGGTSSAGGSGMNKDTATAKDQQTTKSKAVSSAYDAQMREQAAKAMKKRVEFLKLMQESFLKLRFLHAWPAWQLEELFRAHVAPVKNGKNGGKTAGDSHQQHPSKQHWLLNESFLRTLQHGPTSMPTPENCRQVADMIEKMKQLLKQDIQPRNTPIFLQIALKVLESAYFLLQKMHLACAKVNPEPVFVTRKEALRIPRMLHRWEKEKARRLVPSERVNQLPEILQIKKEVTDLNTRIVSTRGRINWTLSRLEFIHLRSLKSTEPNGTNLLDILKAVQHLLAGILPEDQLPLHFNVPARPKYMESWKPGIHLMLSDLAKFKNALFDAWQDVEDLLAKDELLKQAKKQQSRSRSNSPAGGAAREKENNKQTEEQDEELSIGSYWKPHLRRLIKACGKPLSTGINEQRLANFKHCRVVISALTLDPYTGKFTNVTSMFKDDKACAFLFKFVQNLTMLKEMVEKLLELKQESKEVEEAGIFYIWETETKRELELQHRNKGEIARMREKEALAAGGGSGAAGATSSTGAVADKDVDDAIKAAQDEAIAAAATKGRLSSTTRNVMEKKRAKLEQLEQLLLAEQEIAFSQPELEKQLSGAAGTEQQEDPDYVNKKAKHEALLLALRAEKRELDAILANQPPSTSAAGAANKGLLRRSSTVSLEKADSGVQDGTDGTNASSAAAKKALLRRMSTTGLDHTGLEQEDLPASLAPYRFANDDRHPDEILPGGGTAANSAEGNKQAEDVESAGAATTALQLQSPLNLKRGLPGPPMSPRQAGAIAVEADKKYLRSLKSVELDGGQKQPDGTSTAKQQDFTASKTPGVFGGLLKQEKYHKQQNIEKQKIQKQMEQEVPRSASDFFTGVKRLDKDLNSSYFEFELHATWRGRRIGLELEKQLAQENGVEIFQISRSSNDTLGLQCVVDKSFLRLKQDLCQFLDVSEVAENEQVAFFHYHSGATQHWFFDPESGTVRTFLLERLEEEKKKPGANKAKAVSFGDASTNNSSFYASPGSPAATGALLTGTRAPGQTRSVSPGGTATITSSDRSLSPDDDDDMEQIHDPRPGFMKTTYARRLKKRTHVYDPTIGGAIPEEEAELQIHDQVEAKIIGENNRVTKFTPIIQQQRKEHENQMGEMLEKCDLSQFGMLPSGTTIESAAFPNINLPAYIRSKFFNPTLEYVSDEDENGNVLKRANWIFNVEKPRTTAKHEQHKMQRRFLNKGIVLLPASNTFAGTKELNLRRLEWAVEDFHDDDYHKPAHVNTAKNTHGVNFTPRSRSLTPPRDGRRATDNYKTSESMLLPGRSRSADAAEHYERQFLKRRSTLMGSSKNLKFNKSSHLRTISLGMGGTGAGSPVASHFAKTLFQQQMQLISTSSLSSSAFSQFSQTTSLLSQHFMQKVNPFRVEMVARSLQNKFDATAADERALLKLYRGRVMVLGLRNNKVVLVPEGSRDQLVFLKNVCIVTNKVNMDREGGNNVLFTDEDTAGDDGTIGNQPGEDLAELQLQLLQKR
ncbi:unnamed protein product [Amoebophrya sp. A120]|nr:unnamed protein product [Amoebophrya sp. A120]|eukprot:GSA120T00012364001.1